MNDPAGPGDCIRMLVWNVAWREPDSVQGVLMRAAIRRINPGLLCLTETVEDFLPVDGYSMLAEADYGYAAPKGRRKVALWSRSPWTQVDPVGSEALPSGRLIAGVTSGIRVIGVCVPWQQAHVRTGRRNRAPWEDHIAYLRALRPVHEKYAALPEPICIVGDFNQRIPLRFQPAFVYRELTAMLGSRFNVATAGMVDAQGEQLIDHIVSDRRLRCHVDEIIPRFGPDGAELSDHVGIVASLILS